MIINGRNQNRHTRFYCLLFFLLGLCFVRYGLQINFPKAVFLAVVILIAVLGNQDEIIAMMICCIPLHTSLSFFYALIICLAVFVLRYYKEICLNISVAPIFMMIIWELLHCYSKPFSIMTFATNFIPLLVLAVILSYKKSKIDYSLICRAFSISIIFMCFVMLGKLLYVARFNVLKAMSGLWRLGADTTAAQEALLIEGGHQNPNTLGILCVIGICGLLQLRRMGLGNKYDLIQILLLLVFGTLTSSRTYLACLAIMIILFWLSQEGGIRRKFKLSMQILFFLAIALIILYAIFPAAVEFFATRLTTKDKYASRGEIMIAYHNFIVSNPKVLLLGIGLNNYFTEIVNHFRIATAVPHNAIQEMVIAWGLPSIAMFAMLGLTMVSQSRRYCRKQGLINYIPILIILAKSMVGQLLDSPYTLLALSFGYLSMRQEMSQLQKE